MTNPWFWGSVLSLIFVIGIWFATPLPFWFLVTVVIVFWVDFFLKNDAQASKAVRGWVAGVILVLSAVQFDLYPIIALPELSERTVKGFSERREQLDMLAEDIVRNPSVGRERYLRVACDMQQTKFDEDLRQKILKLSTNLKPLDDLKTRASTSLLTQDERDIVEFTQKISAWRSECAPRAKVPVFALQPKTPVGYWLVLAPLFLYGFGLWKKARSGNTRWISIGGFVILTAIIIAGCLFFSQGGSETVSKWVEGFIPKPKVGDSTSTSALSISVTASNPGDRKALLKAEEGERVTINSVRDDSARSVFYTLPKCVGKRIHTEVVGGPWDADWPVVQQWLEDGTYLDFRDVPAPYFREPKLTGYSRGKIPVVPLHDLGTRLEGGGRVAIFQTATLALWCEPVA